VPAGKIADRLADIRGHGTPPLSEGRIVVLTGATRGLGRSLALRLAELGNTVLACGRSPEAVAELSTLLGEPHDVAAVDVADPTAVHAWAVRLLAAHLPPDLVINNAGQINANAPLWEVPVAEFKAVLDSCVAGTFHVARAFLPSMLARGSGVVVNVSSAWGRSAAPEVAPYCAAKWAIEGLTRSLAQELPLGLAAVAVNPGLVHTAMLESCFGRAAQTYPGPDRWALRAAPFLLGLGVADNGKSVTVPGF
jgi:NAD(P)-dependent dehydrogenase (short-subunit alcohol dehydrogenase family)